MLCATNRRIVYLVLVICAGVICFSSTIWAEQKPAGGAKVYRVLCDACHTMSGANGLVHLTDTWTDDQLRLNIAKLQRTKGFMPPFAGNADDVEAIVQLIRWERASRPASWADTSDPETVAEITRWLEEAGTQ